MVKVFKTTANVGGEITGYTEMMNEARQISTERMIQQAQQMGADAFVATFFLMLLNYQIDLTI